MKQGKVGAVLVYNCNPAYDYQNAEDFVKALEKVELKVSFADIAVKRPNICSLFARITISWNHGMMLSQNGLFQPGPTNNSKLLIPGRHRKVCWSGWEKPDYYEYIRSYWENNLLIREGGHITFASLWNKSLHDGIFELKPANSPQPEYKQTELKAAKPKTNNEFELVLFESIAIGNGKHANNPWLQELPDAISKVTWDNFIAVSPADADEKGWETEDMLKFDNGMEVPVIVQAGQPRVLQQLHLDMAYTCRKGW